MHLRELPLPAGVPGRVFLHGMPGRRESLGALWDALGRLEVGVILNLTSDEEVEGRLPAYANALAGGTVPCDVWRLSMADAAAPGEEAAFDRILRRLAEGLRGGSAFLIDCNAGIGRTGTVATGLLMMLGLPLAHALRTVQSAGSGPVTPDQHGALMRLADRLARRRDSRLV